MSSATLELYHALVSAGVSEEKAERAAKAVISREEAKEFVTKADLRSEIEGLKAEMYKALVMQSGFIVAAVGLLLAFMR